jgi:DNA-binding GntR family transcriptional regulator
MNPDIWRDRDPSGSARTALSADEAGQHAQMPLYALVRDRLRGAITAGAVPQGTVLLEGPLAERLKSTRGTVRRALKLLEAEGLLSRFEGRGFMVGAPDNPVRRIALDDRAFSADPSGILRKTQAWETVYAEVERDMVLLSMRGSFRLNEHELARHYGVGRKAAHDVLQRLEALGIVSKDDRARWSINCLDTRRISDLYALRMLLEPRALRNSMAHCKPPLDAMMARLEHAMAAYPRVSRAELDTLELDLHVHLLAGCANKELLLGLQRTHCLLTMGQHILGGGQLPAGPAPFLAEHLGVLQAIGAGRLAVAEELLHEHLRIARQKVLGRVETLRYSIPPPHAPYTL